MEFKLIKTMFASMLLLVSSLANASLITIDFEGFNLGTFSSGVEDGVAITGAGLTPEVFNDLGFGTGKVMLSNSCCGTSSVFEFTLQSGGIFSFVQFDIGSFSALGDDVVVEGYLGGISQGIDSFQTTAVAASGAIVTEESFNLLGVEIDLLTILMDNDVNFPMMDNIVLDDSVNVPEPSTLAIFVLGMIGLASRRFKKQS